MTAEASPPRFPKVTEIIRLVHMSHRGGNNGKDIQEPSHLVPCASRRHLQHTHVGRSQWTAHSLEISNYRLQASCFVFSPFLSSQWRAACPVLGPQNAIGAWEKKNRESEQDQKKLEQWAEQRTRYATNEQNRKKEKTPIPTKWDS